VKYGGCVGLTTLPPSMSRLSRQCGILNILGLLRQRQLPFTFHGNGNNLSCRKLFNKHHSPCRHSANSIFRWGIFPLWLPIRYTWWNLYTLATYGSKFGKIKQDAVYVTHNFLQRNIFASYLTFVPDICNTYVAHSPYVCFMYSVLQGCYLSLNE
jgi:hypothetical protein